MKKLSAYLIVFLTLAVAASFLTGCGGDEDLVLADVGGDKIYAQDLDDIFERNRETFLSFDEELEWRNTILDSLIIQQLLSAITCSGSLQEEYRRIRRGQPDCPRQSRSVPA